MSAGPRNHWYLRKEPTNKFRDLRVLSDHLKAVYTRFIIDVKEDHFQEHETLIQNCEKLIELYWIKSDRSKNEDYQEVLRKLKRDPYNILLEHKFNLLMELLERRFCQLRFVLKKVVETLLGKASESDIYLTWALKIIKLHNKCGKTTKILEDGTEVPLVPEFDPNIISNTFSKVMLPYKPLDFAFVLQRVSRVRVEKTALDLIYSLLNIGSTQPGVESSSSSMEIYRTLTSTLNTDTQMLYEPSVGLESKRRRNPDILRVWENNETNLEKFNFGRDPEEVRNFRRIRMDQILESDRNYIVDLIMKAKAVCPSVFGRRINDLQTVAERGMRSMWSYMGTILDHVLIWWMEIPLSLYPVDHIDSVRKYLYSLTPDDLPEPIYSTVRGVADVLTSFICIVGYDQLFSYTLVSTVCTAEEMEQTAEPYRDFGINEHGTATGIIWAHVFLLLITLSNTFVSTADVENVSQLPVSEQIPVLHRIDHSIHSMRLWVLEQAKYLCSEWKIDILFQILDHDLKTTLDLFKTLKLPNLTADASDVILMVNVALRQKLILEINANLEKLKEAHETCIHILSSACGVLSLANFSLCFPPAQYWRKNSYENEEENSSSYVGYVLDQILLPVIKATKNIDIYKLILKIICESWVDHIYKNRIKFSVNGAMRLLNDFDQVREWIVNCPLLDEQQLDKLSDHEVLRMCKGVAKVLLRKPEDIIPIAKSPKIDKKPAAGETSDTAQDTQLPSEMFVPNQQNWLQLRASSSGFKFWNICCGDDVL